MSKYVCDFDAVKTIANNLKKQVSDMNNSLSAYENNLQSDLNGWSGLAQKEFIGNSEQLIANTRKYINSIDELATFLANSVTNIENAEAEISSINI